MSAVCVVCTLSPLQVWWPGPTILSANQSASLLSLTLRAPEPLLQLTAYLVLHTNVTELRLPVTCYTGKLRPVRDDTGKLRPVRADTGKLRPVRDDTGKLRPVRADAGKLRPVRDDTGKLRPVRADTGKLRPVRADTGKLRPVRDDTGAARVYSGPCGPPDRAVSGASGAHDV